MKPPMLPRPTPRKTNRISRSLVSQRRNGTVGEGIAREVGLGIGTGRESALGGWGLLVQAATKAAESKPDRRRDGLMPSERCRSPSGYEATCIDVTGKVMTIAEAI